MTTHLFLVAAISTIAAGAAPAEAAAIRHVPPADVTAGEALELVAEAPSSTPTLTLHYREAGATTPFTTIELVRRDERTWVAVVPAVAVLPPGLDYYFAAGGEAVFASAAWPHTMPVVAPPDDERRSRDMVRAAGRRSRIHTQFEWVNYGTRTVGGTKLTDSYYRVDADFTYRLWAYPLEELRGGYTRLLGETESMSCSGAPPCTDEAGFKVAGWFGVGLAVAEGFRLDGDVIVMATQTGFQPGGRGEARLGDREASHIALGVEHLADVGTRGFFRLGWGTVPRFPMAATVEITNAPAEDRDAGVRLYYDLSHALPNGFRIGVRAGYAARNQEVAGFTGGAAASVDF